MDVQSTVKVSTRCARCRRPACVTIHTDIHHEDARDRAADVLVQHNWGKLSFRDGGDNKPVMGVICSQCCNSFDGWMWSDVGQNESRADDPAEEYEVDS